jgi:hypothetical protein
MAGWTGLSVQTNAAIARVDGLGPAEADRALSPRVPALVAA